MTYAMGNKEHTSETTRHIIETQALALAFFLALPPSIGGRPRFLGLAAGLPPPISFSNASNLSIFL